MEDNSSSIALDNARDAKSQPSGELQALLARVEAATEPDQEVDGRIWCWLEGHSFVAMSDGRKCWADYGENDAVGSRSVPSAGYLIFRHKAPDRGNAVLQGFHAPTYTASLDATLELVASALPGWGAEVGYPARLGEHSGRPWADLWMARDDARLQKGERWPRQGPCHSNAPTPALALIAALLKALIAQAASPAAGNDGEREEP